MAGGALPLARAAAFSPNDAIQVGCIGTGGRCRRLMETLVKIPGVRITALCDIWEEHLEKAKALSPAGVWVTRDYHQLLARQDVDAVLIGAPDHWHVSMTIDACRAGKDVYVEKPLTHDLWEGAEAVRAQNENQRIVQVGSQHRSMPHFQKGREMVRSGLLGKIHKVRITWNRNHFERMRPRRYGIDPKTLDWGRFLGRARPQPFDEYRFRNWRWFWDFGGGTPTDLMVHYQDIVNWYLEPGHPASAVALGGNYATKGLWETPDTISLVAQYPESELLVMFEGTFVNARSRNRVEFMGSEATLYLDRGRLELYPEQGSSVEPREWILGEGERGADFYANPDGERLHLENWLDSIRTRKKPYVPAEAGVLAAEAPHLANMAYRARVQANWPRELD